MKELDKIISLAKRRGFIYPGSEIYGGLSGTWDYGPLGVELKNNIKSSWWNYFVHERKDIYGLDAAVLMNSKTWESSGHVAGFSDPLVECKKCHKRFRADHLLLPPTLGIAKGGGVMFCPECSGELTGERQFNMMFQTFIGPVEDTAAKIYLRPETAQGIFVNFKNIIDSFHPKLPFGVAQIGKSFRNEITPKDFIFRTREFEQMEIEYFISPPVEREWEKQFDYWRKETMKWVNKIGVEKNITEVDVPPDARAHYSKKTTDFNYNFPFGQDELFGLAYRGDFDLKNHKLEYYDEETKKSFTPHVIEPSFGVDRMILALLCEAYTEDVMGGEKRAYLKLKPDIAPIKTAVFPLLRNKPGLIAKAREVFNTIKKEIRPVIFDDDGNIGKRYRRQDEIGTPFCVTVDFDTLENDTATLRDRDSGKQERYKTEELVNIIKSKL